MKERIDPISADELFEQMEQVRREELAKEFPKRVWGLPFETLEEYEAADAERMAAEQEAMKITNRY